MLLRILLVLLALQLTDLYLLFALGRSIGFWETLVIVVGMGFLGSALARREGLRVWRGWRAALEGQRLPERGIVDGMLVLLGGGLLILPGLLTDVIGLVLLVPVSRRLITRLIVGRLQNEIERRSPRVVPNVSGFGERASFGHGPADSNGQGATVIDTTGVESPEPKARLARHVEPSPDVPGRPGKH
jgi:UPF0716 protein FxsA